MDTDARTDKVWYSTCREYSISGVGKTPKDSKCAWRTVAPNEGKRTPGIDGEPSRTFTGIKVGAVARLRYGLWRAECVTKGACSVRGGATGDRWLRDPTAPVVYSTGGLDILFISEILPNCGEWHAIASFSGSVPPQYIGGSLLIPS